MSDLEERVKVLEEKVKILEETLETVKNMNLSEQMKGYIQKRSQALRLVDLLNSVSNQPTLDFSEEEERIRNIKVQKSELDKQIAKAVTNAEDLFNQPPDSPRNYSYTVETGIETSDANALRWRLKEFRQNSGSGIRITGYNGFDSERLILPPEIDGLPVVSIGEKAFMNASFSEIVLPNSIKAIMRYAFYGCANLHHIILPEEVIFLGESCFGSSGIQSFSCPDSITVIPNGCFSSCLQLENVHFGNSIKKLGAGAFNNCNKLLQISIPESVREIERNCFLNTGIKYIIIPAKTERVSFEVFGLVPRSARIAMVFCGEETTIHPEGTVNDVSVIYCLPGSKMQKYAREHKIPMRPLSEFNMEDYNV